MTRDAYNLTQMLNRIWRFGDQDEQSIKHIGHGLASLLAYGTWTKMADYTLPESWWSEKEFVNEYRRNHLLKLISPTWEKVRAMYERLGPDRFIETLKETQFSYYALEYIEESWLPYHEALKKSA